MRKSSEESSRSSSSTRAPARAKAASAPSARARKSSAATIEPPPAEEESLPPPAAKKKAAKKKAVKKKAAAVSEPIELSIEPITPAIAPEPAAKKTTRKKVAAEEPVVTPVKAAGKKAAKKKSAKARATVEDSQEVSGGRPEELAPPTVSIPLPKILELVESDDLPPSEDGRPIIVPASGPAAADLPEIPPVPEFSHDLTLDFGEPVPAPPELLHPSMRPRPQGAPAASAPAAAPASAPGQVTRQSFPREGKPQRHPQAGQPAPQSEPYGDDPEDGDEGEFEGRPGFRDRKRGKKNGLSGDPVPCSGILEVSPKGFGFLRRKELCFRQTTRDVFVLPDTVRHFGLREGMLVEGEAKNGPRGPQMTEIFRVNGREPGSHKGLPFFEELTAINPQKRFLLETTPDKHTTRVIDMFTPVGKGQRGLIVAPPRTGKTTLLHDIAEAISNNYEDVHLMLMLIDERPEEVTELSRALPNAEILASSNDNDVWAHLRIAEFGIQRAKRLVEEGRDVFILLDSITRLARAYNNAMTGKGRTMSGGVDARALEMPRRLFAAARNTREAGSLTIIGTALIETNSKADELIFQEFKGTGNMEIVLERKMAEQYVYPAVNIFKSGTRREELLLPPHQLKKIHLIRRGLAGHKPIEAMDRMLHFLRNFQSNAQMLIEIKAKGY